MPIAESLARFLTHPEASVVAELRADLLEAGIAHEAPIWELLGQVYDFLNSLATSTSSRDYSHLASMLDISAISGVVVEELIEETSARELALRLLGGFLTEGLMALATRQHVKAWQGEIGSVFRGTAWFLYEALWRWAERLKPELEAAERRRLLDRLLEPLHDANTADTLKALLIGRLFQILVVSALADLVGDEHGETA